MQNAKNLKQDAENATKIVSEKTWKFMLRMQKGLHHNNETKLYYQIKLT